MGKILELPTRRARRSNADPHQKMTRTYRAAQPGASSRPIPLQHLHALWRHAAGRKENPASALIGPIWRGTTQSRLPKGSEFRGVLPACDLSCLRAAAALLLAVGPWPAHAQGKLDARYVATLAGIPIGKGAWVIDISDDQYTAAASGMTTGLLSVFAGGQGSGASRGTISAGQPVAASYAATLVTERKRDEVRMLFASGNVQ